MSEFRRRLIAAVSQNESDIPAGCVRCKYLESFTDANNSNGQWIDTERILTDTDEFGITIMCFANSGDKSAFGWRWAGTYADGYHCLINTTPAGQMLFAFGVMTNNGIRYNLKTKYTFAINPNTKKITVNDAIINTSSMDWTKPYNNGTTGIPIPLFASKSPNVSSGSNCRIYDYWVKDKDGNYIQHLVPILDKNGKPCMYDIIGKKYHYNQRTDRTEDFIYKIMDMVEIPAGCVRCEYLESTGTQWIDTEYTPTRGDELEIDRYIVTQNTAAPTLFGAGDETSQFVAVHNSSGLYVRYFSDISKAVSSIGYTRFHSLLVNQNGDIYVDDTFYATSSPLYNDVNTTLAIFNRGNRAASFIGYIGTVTITRDNVRVLHLIPCLDTKGTPCYYDVVNKKFHYNKGTGEFLYKILEQ